MSSPADAGSPRLTVVVLNYNGRPLLQAMLASLNGQLGEPFRTLVVDNGSEDDSLDFIRSGRPEVELLALDRNIGVTAALNRGLEAVDSEYVALFNNDVELEPGCLAELLGALDSHPEAGSATPKMLDFTERSVIDGAGDLLNWRGGGERRGHGERDTGQYGQPEEVFGACGGAVLFRREALLRVGTLDEAYFAYYEDIDWAFRAQLAGFRCRYVPTAIVYHHGSATLGRGFNDFNAYHLWRNPTWLVIKCFPGVSLLRHAPDVLIGLAGNLYRAIRVRRVRVWMRATRDALVGVPSALARRRAIQQRRVITPAELDRLARLGRR